MWGTGEIFGDKTSGSGSVGPNGPRAGPGEILKFRPEQTSSTRDFNQVILDRLPSKTSL
jgi:hypothetical protein